ncbi:MAG: zf-HC2 domain-containing protein [Treponema sp.]|nr:zf-HC2 domain-containing protein [Treponema sp.]
MCPDREIVSVYLDNELPSPWKEKMEAHLADCPGCRARLDRYRLVSQALREEVPALEEATRERVWKTIGAGRTDSMVFTAVRRVWRGSVTVPVPVIAAAAALFAFTLGFAWIGRSADRYREQTESMASAGIELDAPGIMPLSDMNSVLQYLSGEDSGDTMILLLPESKSFTSVGEPAIIKAADYPRRYQSP